MKLPVRLMSVATLLLGVVLASGVLLSTAAQAQPVTPAAYWRFEDPLSLTVAQDSSGNGNTGTITGATYTDDTPTLAGTSNVAALSFNAKGDYVTIPAGPETELNTFNDGITLEAFIKPFTLPIPADTADQRVKYIIWADDGAYDMHLVSNAEGGTFLRGAVNLVGGNTGPCTASVSAQISNFLAGKFSHVALTYASETLRLYLNGVQIDDGAAAAGCGSKVGPVSTFREIVRIGSDETAVGFPTRDRDFRGVIDEVRITGSALQPSQFLFGSPEADLTLTKEASPDPVVVGGEITYTLTVRNNGPAVASNVVLVDTLPENATFVSVSPLSCDPSASAVTCPLGTIEAGGAVTVTITVRADTVGDITNQARVSAIQDDPNPADNEVSITTSAADLSLTPGDFGPEADRINFDGLMLGNEVDFQLMMQGVILQSQDGLPVRVVDTTAMGGNRPNSPPHAVTTQTKGLPLEVLFTSPRNKVGMYFGNLPGPATGVLRAFDIDDKLLGQVSVSVDAGAAGNVTNFIGLGVAETVIDYVTLEFPGIDVAKTIDDLMVEPAQDDLPEVREAVEGASATLRSPTSTTQQRLDAIGVLQIHPSTGASAALQEAARSDADQYVRERAIMALAQLRDPDAIPTLVQIGLAQPTGNVGTAAHHAVWALREDFPMPDPPVITLEAITPIKVDTEFVVEGRVVSPVDRDMVQISLMGSKLLLRVRTDPVEADYQGPLRAGQEVVVRATFLAREAGQTALPLTVRVSRDLVDATTYTAHLYVEFDETTGTGSASMEPFYGADQVEEHVIEEEDPDLGQTAPEQGDSIVSHRRGRRDALVTGTILFDDGDALPNLGFNFTGTKPARLVKVEVFRTGNPGTRFGSGHTDNSGRFFISAEDVWGNTNLSLELEIDSFAAKVWADRDLGHEELKFRLAGAVNSGTSGTIDFGTRTVSPRTSGYRTIEIDQNGFLPGGHDRISVHFAAAININEVVLVGRADAITNRDPREGDSIGKVNVEYCDEEGSQYFLSLVLTCGRIDGVNIGAGLDTGFIDGTIAHEYGHHLQKEIGTWDGHAGGHNFCREIDTDIWNDPEFAWSEGFANYFEAHIVQNNPGMSLVNVNNAEFGCGVGGSGVTFVDLGSNERWYSVEGHITATLWDLADGLGGSRRPGSFPITDATNTIPILITSPNHRLITGQRVRITGVTGNDAANGDFTITRMGANQFALNGTTGLGDYTGGGAWREITTDPWDRVAGQPGSLNGHRTIMQIFDRELDRGSSVFADAPDLRDFYPAWVGRTGLDWTDGSQALDSILSGMGVFPGGDFFGLKKMTPRPLIEADPVLPGVAEASITIGGATMPQYNQSPIYNPPPDALLTPPPSPTLIIDRQYSYLDSNPVGASAPADQFVVQVGVTNLGPLRMEVDVEGTTEQGNSASYERNIDFTPGGGPIWLTAAPGNSTFENDQAPETVDLRMTFQQSAYLLNAGTYRADIDLTFTINHPVPAGSVSVVTETIRLNFQVLQGPDDDFDGDGVSNIREREILPFQNPGRFGCLDPKQRDSDVDGLSDGREINDIGTSPCDRDTDDDGMRDGLEARHPCLDPLTHDVDADADSDGLTNGEEVLRTFPSDPCDGDTDDDGSLDGFDNCLLTPNPDQSDLDGDGRGDVCDGDIDGDGCVNLFDPNPEDVDNPDEACLARPLDPALDRTGRIITGFDERLNDPRLHALITGLLGPQEPGQCGPVDCPPPRLRVFDEDFRTVLVDVPAAKFGFTEKHFFGQSSRWVPDRDNDGQPDIAVGVPLAPGPDGTGTPGAVLIVSSMTGEELARIEGKPDSGFGTSLALRDNNELMVGGPGSASTPGSVHVFRLSDLGVVQDFTADQPGDGFGTSLALIPDIDGDRIPEAVIGAPGDSDGAGAVYTASSDGTMAPLATGGSVGDRFGHAVANMGDITRDGQPEVLVGAPGRSLPDGQGLDQPAGVSQAGEIAILQLDSEPVCRRAGTEPNERLGAALATIPPDPRLGGMAVALAGAPGWNNDTGRAYLLDENCQELGVFSGEQEGARLGAQVATGPDFDNDGLPSLVVVEANVFVEGEGVGRSAFYNWQEGPPPEVCGDQNNDGATDIRDIIIDLQITVGSIEPTADQKRLSDLDRDGNINVFDAIIGLQRIVGLAPSPGECGPLQT